MKIISKFHPKIFLSCHTIYLYEKTKKFGKNNLMFLPKMVAKWSKVEDHQIAPLVGLFDGFYKITLNWQILFIVNFLFIFWV